MKKYTIKGTGCQDYGKHIINFFEKLGGVNKEYVSGDSDEGYYFINEFKEIELNYVTPSDHTEIELLSNGMAKGVWYKDADDDYFKPQRLNQFTCGEIIFDKIYKKNDYYGLHCESNFTPLTDLTEIQEFLPDGHEDKYKPEPTDLIEPSTECAPISITISEYGIMIYGITSIEKAIKKLQELI
jgi:hypothetical protein